MGQEPLQPRGLGDLQGPPLAGCQAIEAQGWSAIHQIDGHSHQPQGREAHGRCHPAHLAVATLTQGDLQPGGGDGGAKTDRRIPGRQVRDLQGADPGGQGGPALQQEAPAQLLELLGGWRALHLHPIAAPMPPSRIGELVLQRSMVGEQQQALAVGIKASGGVHTRTVEVVGEGAPAAAGFGRELTEHAVGLVEQQGCQGPARLTATA